MPDKGKATRLQGLLTQLHAHRRSLSGLLLLVLLGLTGKAGMQWLSDPYRFPLNLVEVEGEFRYLQKTKLQAALAPHATGGFFTVEVDRVRAAAEALPWVLHAKVRRVWPATLRVHITEQQAVAGWNDTGYLNTDGVPFTPTDGQNVDGLPQLAGPDGQSVRVLRRYRLVSRTLQGLGLKVTRLAMDRRHAWSLQLDNGTTLALGRAQPWNRLQRFVRVFPEVFAARLTELERVDMRYSNGFSVSWQSPPSGGEVIAQQDS